MNRRDLLRAMAIAGAAFMFSGAAYAACTSEVAKDDLSDDQIVALYDCIKDSLREGYAKEGNQWTAEYPSWGATSTQPVAPGPHGGRFLNTFVNEVGHAEYVKFLDERGPMPVGTVLAKESFNVNKKNKVQKGPLFFMEKVAAGNADEFGNWVYTVIRPDGKPHNASQKFCHDCHGAFAEQDSMGYPDEDYRISAE